MATSSEIFLTIGSSNQRSRINFRLYTVYTKKKYLSLSLSLLPVEKPDLSRSGQRDGAGSTRRCRPSARRRPSSSSSAPSPSLPHPLLPLPSLPLPLSPTRAAATTASPCGACPPPQWSSPTMERRERATAVAVGAASPQCCVLSSIRVGSTKP